MAYIMVTLFVWSSLDLPSQKMLYLANILLNTFNVSPFCKMVPYSKDPISLELKKPKVASTMALHFW